MASAGKKTYRTEEVLQKIFETDDEGFSFDIDSKGSEEDEEDKEPGNKVSIIFVDEKDVDFDMNTAENANDDEVADDDVFVTIFIFLSMIMTSSNYFYLFQSKNF